MIRLILQYAAAGLLGVASRAGGLVADDLVSHQDIDWPVVLGESIKTVLPLISTLAVAMHLNDIGSHVASRRLRLRQPPTTPPTGA
jgi:hypothetical protein